MASRTDLPPPLRRRVAVVLSGGGARGAYEVGVLSWIFEEITRLKGRPPKVHVLAGTSVGAINACFLAAHMSDPVLGMRRLVELWLDLHTTQVLGFGPAHIAQLPKMLLGGGLSGVGIFDARPMQRIVETEITWRAITRCLERHELRALSISTNEVQTGRTHVFMQTSPDWELPRMAPPRTLFRAATITADHALASAAIPLIFPPVRIAGELFIDGGLRQNTPIAPALRLGATHVLAIGSSREVRGTMKSENAAPLKGAPIAPFLLGKVSNAFLLDHFDADIELLERLNHVIEDGELAFGSSFASVMNAAARSRGGPAYRAVKALAIRPSEDIGRLAADHIRRGQYRADQFLSRRIYSVFDLGFSNEADLASYILFDGIFARRLIEMGRADARARREELVAFFDEDFDVDIIPPPSSPLGFA
jgi:NTE family protein